MPKSVHLVGKTAFITGASGALGSDIARALVERGVRVALVARNGEKLEKLAAELGGKDKAVAIRANVRDLDSLIAAAALTAEHFGGIDIVVAGAGVATPRPSLTCTESEFAADIDTNLAGVWRTFRATLPHIKKSRGHLLAVSSLAAFIHMPGMVAYSASKAGVEAVCNTIRLELDGTGVTVGTLNPTFFASELEEALLASDDLANASAGFKGAFAPVQRERVVRAAMTNIERRSRTTLVPPIYHITALAAGAAQRVLEPFMRMNMRRARH